jgi:4-amino-4-deoxy-L-arabinose transferase-like glycosyltransferase
MRKELRMKKDLISIFALTLLAIFFITSYSRLVTSGYLGFSDGAKFAEVAKNIFVGLGYGSKFTFFSPPPLEFVGNRLFSAKGVLVGMPLILSLIYKIFGVSDFSVIFTSGAFYVGLVVMTYLLGKKIYGKEVGIFSAIAIAVNVNFLDYATSGASEVLFTFMILAGFYCIAQKKHKYSVIALLIFIASYFVRPQAFLYIIAGVFYWLFLNYNNRKAFIFFISVLIIGYLADRILPKLLSNFPYYYSVAGIAGYSATQHLPGESVSDALRQTGTISSSAITILKKYLYDMYNFYRLLPQIISPYLAGLFLVGVFRVGRDKNKILFNITTAIVVFLVFSAVALSIPFFRYLHPVIPFIYIVSSATIIWLAGEISEKSTKRVNRFITKTHIKINSKNYFNAILFSLLLFYVVGQTLGVIFLDSRYKADITNKGKKPIYVVLSEKLKENTKPDDVIVTNLDTWGSWYGDRRTIWFPLKPSQLTADFDEEVQFNAIYLTSYLIDDDNYYMGDEWRQIFYNPEDPESEFIAKNYKLGEIFEIDKEDVYEDQDARAVLLVRKEE